jgi:hypothetical protein
MFCPGLLDVGFCTLYDDALFYDYVGGPGFLPSPDRESSDVGARGAIEGWSRRLIVGFGDSHKVDLPIVSSGFSVLLFPDSCKGSIRL